MNSWVLLPLLLLSSSFCLKYRTVSSSSKGSGGLSEDDITATTVKSAIKCSCPDASFYFCGTDQKTYDSPCHIGCAGVRPLHYGKCLGKSLGSNCKCLLVNAPVCGADGVTYPNTCVLRCAGVSLARRGKC